MGIEWVLTKVLIDTFTNETGKSKNEEKGEAIHYTYLALTMSHGDECKRVMSSSFLSHIQTKIYECVYVCVLVCINI